MSTSTSTKDIALPHPLEFPVDPLDRISIASDAEFRRRTVRGVLESYNGSYDVLAEAVQNAVDALEDAKITGQKAPYLLEVTVNLDENWLSVLDTGIGMTPDQVASGFAPCVSFKCDPVILKRREKNPYRGHKGVGLTFLAYGTDEIVLHSKNSGQLTKGRMQYGRAWSEGRRPEPARIVEDKHPSPLDKHARGTYIKIFFSDLTRPKSLSRLAGTFEAWKTILRTRTAAGQILLGCSEVVQIDLKLTLVGSNTTKTAKVDPLFLYASEIRRTPPFRFLDLNEYWKNHSEQSTPPVDKLRQDGLYLKWDTEKIKSELTVDQREQFTDELKKYSPHLYAFIPYQGSVWGDLNFLCTGVRNRAHLYPGLMLAVHGQRLADIFEIDATRYETFSRNVLVIIQFNDARPDYGRKTLQDEVIALAKKASDRVVQYLAKQRELLRPPGESPTPEQRQIERDHGDWLYNVKKHEEVSPLLIPPVTYASTPLTEQDVVGLFNQMTSVGVFPGIRIFATSQSHTYDCLVNFNCKSDAPGLAYKSPEDCPLGVSPFILGDHPQFVTKDLTVEFKNNLDALVEDFDGDSDKLFKNVNVCVCWGKIGDSFKGYSLEPITEHIIDERQFPGITHLLRKDGDTHVLQIVMLENIVSLIKSGKLKLLAGAPAIDNEASPDVAKPKHPRSKR